MNSHIVLHCLLNTKYPFAERLRCSRGIPITRACRLRETGTGTEQPTIRHGPSSSCELRLDHGRRLGDYPDIIHPHAACPTFYEKTAVFSSWGAPGAFCALVHFSSHAVANIPVA